MLCVPAGVILIIAGPVATKRLSELSKARPKSWDATEAKVDFSPDGVNRKILLGGKQLPPVGTQFSKSVTKTLPRRSKAKA